MHGDDDDDDDDDNDDMIQHTNRYKMVSYVFIFLSRLCPKMLWPRKRLRDVDV